MSCDGNRQRLFGTLAASAAPLVGSLEDARDLLDTLYDIVSNQAPPEDRVGQLAAAAGFQKMRQRASWYGIDIHPHGPGLPAPESQAAWKAVSDLLDAAEHGKPLSPLTADLQQSLAFRCCTTVCHAWARQPAEGSHYWDEDLRPETRRHIRAMFAAEPGRINDLRRFVPERERVQGTLGAEEHRPWMAEATALLLADPLLRTSLQAAARHYLTLDEADALTPGERTRWGRLLAGLVGVGVGPRGLDGDRRSVVVRGNQKWKLCPACGMATGEGSIHIYPCKPVEAVLATRASKMVAVALAQPEYAHIAPDPSPFVTAERLLVDWMQTGQPDPPEGALAGVLVVLREHDSRVLMWLKACHQARYSPLQPEQIDTRALRDATIRSPIYFERRPCIWENGKLYPQDEYRRRADFGRWAWEGGDLLPPGEQRASIADVDAMTIAKVMMGENVLRDEIRVPDRAPDPPQRRRLAQISWMGSYRVHELWCAPEAPDVL